MKKLILIAMAFSLALSPSMAKSKKAKKNAAAATQQVKRDSIPSVTKEGLFTVTKSGQKWYMSIPDSILGRPILTVTRFVSTTVGAGEYGGEQVNEETVYWEKGVEGNLLLRALSLYTNSKDSSAISTAVRNSAENPIIAAFKIEGKKKGLSKVDVTAFFNGENDVFALSSRQKRQYNLGMLKREASFINSIRTYPINTEVTTTKTYSYNAPTMTGPMAQSTSRILPAGLSTGNVTIKLNTSFVLLPKDPMPMRLFDSRVGYFASGYTWFDDSQQKVERKRFISRWRLEPKDEDIEKMKRGELVEPKKPIIYYIDPATPKQWVPYLIAGVNDWNKAFEKAGFKNAIKALEWPNDSTMSLEDARFSVIRYLASDISNAYGPHVSDPRSGEILETHIGWYHNVMKLVHDWYMIQASAVDPRARSMKFSDELMGDLIRFVSSHEVGHTLGLRHNMGASHQTPVEKLRDKAWVEKHGHTVSIMDYARFNYVAQPEDNIGKDGIYPRIGDYDMWAIEYGYRPVFGMKDEVEEHKYWNKEIIARLKANPALWFGGEGRNQDPRAQTEDLGDNSMLASDYGIKNLKRVIANLPEWTKEEADMNENIEDMYAAVVSQYCRYVGHVNTNVGGHYETFKSLEQDGAVYEPVPRAIQKEAMEWLNKNVFNEPTWLTKASFLNRFTDRPQNYAEQIITRFVSVTPLTNLLMMERLQQQYDASPANYGPAEYIADINRLVFTEMGTAKKVNTYRRMLQRKLVNAIITLATNKAMAARDAQSFQIAELQTIREKARISSKTAADAVTRAHWTSLAQIITQALDAK